MQKSHRAATAVLASAALALGTAGVAATAASAHAAGRHQLPGSTPAWANSAHRVGSSAADTKVTFRVYQDWRGGDAARNYGLSASTPGSAHYGDFLTPKQFHQRFSPSRADTNALKKWLRGQGFKVNGVPANRKYVQARGTLAQASKTFRTGFAQYRVHGQKVRSNTRKLSVPASMSGRVEAVVGPDQSQTLARFDKPSPPAPAFVNAKPCSAHWGEKNTQKDPALDGTALPAQQPNDWAPCGYAGTQLQGAYGMSGAIANGNDGNGVTIGIIDAYASPTIEKDANTYFGKHGLPTFKANQFRQVVPPGTYNRPENPKQDPEGWAGEETLDIEAAHTMAPGANITYIGAPNNYRDLDAIMNKVVDKHLADIVSNSYGYGGEALPTGYIKPQLDTQAQAVAEGISLFFSSGDNGDETGGNPANADAATPDWPASSPLVTAVGGTSLGVDQNDQRTFELGWETAKSTLADGPSWSTPAYQYGAGGGTSRLFAQPDYQKGVVPDTMATGQTSGGRAQPMRVVPDVSALADPTTGMLVGETQAYPDGTSHYGEYRIGGTSLASPLYAGMFALAEQQAGHAYGLANPVLYSPSVRAATLDITKAGLSSPEQQGAVRPDYVNSVDDSNGYVYSLRWFDQDQDLTIHVGPQYDDVTGNGSPTGAGWLSAIATQ